jgi:endoglucanase
MSKLTARHRKIALDLFGLPTAPFQEEHVARYVRSFCERRGLKVRADKFGNLLANYQRGRSKAGWPLLFSAHMDHPGFEALVMTGPRRVRAQWRGGVALEFFQGTGVRFFNEGKWVRGIIRKVTPLKSKPGQMRRADTVEVELRGRGRVTEGALGMWDLPGPAVRGKKIHAPACDDIAGVTSMLCLLEVLFRRRVNTTVYLLFTRAEEVGFAGCLSACKAGTVPKRSAIVGIECSTELPTARMGDGPILRVGDRMSVFSPRLEGYCRQTADELARKDKAFRYQRKLMDGGACESTAFCAYGYEATAVCLALGNYHNMNKRAGRIEREYIHVEDLANMIRLFVALASKRRGYEPKAGAPPKLLEGIRRQHERTLVRTAGK